MPRNPTTWEVETTWIRGHCFTNLDEFARARWPEAFVAVPRVGERVAAAEDARQRPSLRVICVTHAVDRDGPYIRVELHR